MFCAVENVQMLFKGFPDDCDSLKLLRDGAQETGASSRWATEWEEHAKPSLLEASALSSHRIAYSLFKYWL